MTGDFKTTATRRTLLRSIGVGAGIMGLSAAAAKATDGPHFSHGIASGDPTQNAVILWTRVLNGADMAKNITGSWQISKSADFNQLAASGAFKTGPKRDFTVKIDVAGLDADSQYYYRFSVGDIFSPIGKTKTLPRGSNPIDLAVVSCSNYSHGHFHVYGEISRRDYQAVLHLGDYIYEYAEGKYDNPKVLAQGRTSKPKTEILTLEDYRTRYANYRNDTNLQAAHAAHPFICVWDDHEVANDAWKGGAENHNDGEGDFKARQQAAIRAYYEWLPIRETEATANGKIYRTFELGDLASLIMLDTRHIGRDARFWYQKDLPMQAIPFDFTDPEKPVALLSKDDMAAANPDAIKQVTVPFLLSKDGAKPMTDWAKIKTLDPKKLPKGYSYIPDAAKFKSEKLADESRSIMGAEQEAWFADELKASDKPWQIIGQQLLSGKLVMPQIADSDLDKNSEKLITAPQMAYFRMLGQMGLPLNLDAWDGYAACRNRVFASIKEHANNAVLLAGDTHNAWAFDLADANGDAIGVELATAGISSPGLEKYIPAMPTVVRDALYASSPELKYANTSNRGWMELHISHDKIDTNWNFVSSVITPDYELLESKSLSVEKDTHKLMP